jgi:hypothetical protein
MQLGTDDDGFFPWLGDRPWCELTLDRVTLNPDGVSRSTWKFLVCKGWQMTEMVWLTAARPGACLCHGSPRRLQFQLGLTERPNEWCQVRPCNAAGWQEDGSLAKIASVLEIAPPGYSMTRRPCEENFRWPDVVIGTRDWEAVERFLCNMRPDETARWRETHKQHVRIVLQDGERWYLNLLVSETAQRSRITSMAAAKLGRGSKHDERMHLKDVNGRDVPIMVDVVNTKRELVASWRGQASHGADAGGRAVHPGDDAHRVDEEGRPSQRMGQPGKEKESTLPRGSRTRSRGADVLQASQSEDRGTHGTHNRVVQQEHAKHSNGYGAAMMLDLKDDGAGQCVTTADGKRKHSNPWYHVPLLGVEGHTKLIRASGLMSIKTGGSLQQPL